MAPEDPIVLTNTGIVNQVGRLASGNEKDSPLESKIKITLAESHLWRKFNSATNEMIVTKSGRRMFPVLSVSINCLDPKAMYSVIVDFEPTNGTRWKYLNGEWVSSGKQETIATSCSYVHPDSPNFGSHWMSKTVSFTKVKLTNKDSSDGQIMLQSLRKYRPRIHVVKVGCSEKQKRLTAQSFPETEFIAVTAYQNEEITQLKIKHNPFAKAFLDIKERSDDFYQENPPLPYSHMSGWILSAPSSLYASGSPFKPALRLSHPSCDTFNGLRSHRTSPYPKPTCRQIKHSSPGHSYSESSHPIHPASDWSSIPTHTPVTAPPCTQYPPTWQSVGSHSSVPPIVPSNNDPVSSAFRMSRSSPTISLTPTTFSASTFDTTPTLSPVTQCSIHQDNFNDVQGFLRGQLPYHPATTFHPNYSQFNYGGINMQ
ncbi:T-box transcription factor T homolog 1-like [Anneissia japonica]|uniref:T-box transcription factor T homolog 1-like n=1 Tax=Anneissia japonica TaxID=1529436 RepID=UPI001425597C|nr:T-box transcription factor T homolog 1-like [Anneissia japonica]